MSEAYLDSINIIGSPGGHSRDACVISRRHSCLITHPETVAAQKAYEAKQAAKAELQTPAGIARLAAEKQLQLDKDLVAKDERAIAKRQQAAAAAAVFKALPAEERKRITAETRAHSKAKRAAAAQARSDRLADARLNIDRSTHPQT